MYNMQQPSVVTTVDKLILTQEPSDGISQPTSPHESNFLSSPDSVPLEKIVDKIEDEQASSEHRELK